MAHMGGLIKCEQFFAQVLWEMAVRSRLIEAVFCRKGRLATGQLMQGFGISHW